MAGTSVSKHSMLDIFTHPRELRQIPRLGDVMVEKNDVSRLADGEFVWFGHSSYMANIGGRIVLVDPVFDRASPVPFTAEPFPGTAVYNVCDLPRRIDYLLITHDHWDHLEYSTVCAIRDRIGKVVCPLGVGEHFEFWGYDPQKLVELDWHECFGENGVKFTCLPARHFSGRGFTRNQSLWASFMVNNVYFAGDGGYDERFKRIAAEFPNIELAFVENGQYNTEWSQIHTLPEELPQVLRDLKAQRYFSGHNSKFSLSLHPWDEPYANFKRAMLGIDAESYDPIIGHIFKISQQLR